MLPNRATHHIFAVGYDLGFSMHRPSYYFINCLRIYNTFGFYYISFHPSNNDNDNNDNKRGYTRA